MSKKFQIILVIVICLSMLIGCSSKASVQDEATQAHSKLTISGLEQGEIEITESEVMDLESVTAEATGVDSAGKETTKTVKGVLLNTILQTKGASQDDLFAIRLVAGDGYQIEVPKEVLNTRDIIIAYEMDGQPLEDKAKPFRAIIPNERAMYWVRNLISIEVLKGIEEADTTRVIFMETAFNELPQEAYTYYDSTDKAVKNSDILKAYEVDESTSAVAFLASDGLEKNETIEVFTNSYIKFTGKEAPLFLSPDMPKGMHIKNIFSFTALDTVFVSLESAAICCETSSVGDVEGVSVKSIIDKLNNFSKEGTYVLTGLDGYQVEVKYETLINSIIAKTSEGGFKIKNTDKNTSVKDILMIEVK